jgi:hypothetical protein
MKGGLLLSLALPPLVTATVLIAVAFNRAEALEPIVLTERELSLRSRSDDNSVTTMFLQWQHPAGRDSWLDCAKLGTLGMECDMPSTHSDAPRHYARMLPRRVFVAFELGGAAWYWSCRISCTSKRQPESRSTLPRSWRTAARNSNAR